MSTTGPLKIVADGHAIGPGDAWRIDGGEIPEVSTALAAVLGRLWRPRILLHLLRERVPAVPILLHAHIRHPPEDRRDWCRQVSHQDRLPHRVYANVCRGVAVEHVLNCGGPPQTGRSRRGQQEDDARPVGVAIEVCAERFQAGGAENPEWRLARRHVPRAEEIPEHRRRRAQRNARQTKHGEAPASWASQSAMKPASSCGNSTDITTIAADTHNTTAESPRRVEQARRARRSWRPPMASRTTDAPRNHGW